MIKYSKVTNFILFQAGWFACVLGGNAVALPVTVGILVFHLLFIGSWKKERELLAVTLLVGCAVDSFLGNLSVLQFSQESRILPLWLACLWLLFATTLRHSLDWTRKYKWAGAAGGFLAGPLSYYAGTRLTDISLASPEWQSLLILAVVWAIMVPLLQSFSSVWLERYKNTR